MTILGLCKGLFVSLEPLNPYNPIKFIDIKQQKNIFKLVAAGEVAERLKAPLSKSGIL